METQDTIPVHLLPERTIIHYAGRPLYLMEEVRVAGYLPEDAFTNPLYTGENSEECSASGSTED